MDLAVHEQHELTRNRKAQTRAAVPARRRHIGLPKRFEQTRERVWCDADAGIADAEFHADFVAVVVFGGHEHRHAAAAGEFYRVADQIGENLPDTQCVPDDDLRNVGVHVGEQIEFFCARLRGEHGRHRFDERDEFDVEQFELEPARLDLGKIENFIDDREQRFARTANRLAVFALLRRKRRIEQQFRRPDDAVHRRTDLVAHRCDEIGFGARGIFGPDDCQA